MRLSPTIDRGMCPLISVALHLVLQHLSLYYNNGALLVQRIAGSCTRRRDKPYLRLGLALLAACGVGCRRRGLEEVVPWRAAAAAGEWGAAEWRLLSTGDTVAGGSLAEAPLNRVLERYAASA